LPNISFESFCFDLRIVDLYWYVFCYVCRGPDIVKDPLISSTASVLNFSLGWSIIAAGLYLRLVLLASQSSRVVFPDDGPDRWVLAMS
jgi:hypothetical protein